MRIGTIFILSILFFCLNAQALDKTDSKKRVRYRDRTPPVLYLPNNISVEAQSYSGAIVTYTVRVEDNVDKSPALECSPSSGAMFAITQTTVNCTASDKRGNTSSGSFLISVVDTVAPVLTIPNDISSTATTAEGASINYLASAKDTVDGTVNVSCLPRSGSVFPPGQTQVQCSATDKQGNSASAAFAVLLTADNSAPVLTLPATIIKEATSASGAVVNYEVSAQDVLDGSVAVSCSPASREVFALGQTNVNCTATDTQGNMTSGSFLVSIQDNTAPLLTLPSDISQDTSEAIGVAVNFTTTAVDKVDDDVAISCVPTSGSVFSVGSQVVVCEARDDQGNLTTGAFQVIVALLPDDSDDPTPAPTPLGSVALTWSIPASRVGGGALAVTEIASYEIYVLSQSATHDTVLTIKEPTSTGYTVSDLVPDTYYFSISVLDTDGKKSDFSNVITVVIP